MSKINKILLAVVIVLVLLVAGLVVWKFVGDSGYYAVYLRTGDLYFGKLMRFPAFGLKQVYTIQINSQNTENPVSIQKFTNVFWGPEDYLKINHNEVVWTTKLSSTSQLVQLVKTNPNLTAPAQAPGQQQAPASQPAPAETPKK